jgi:hypothetical protein
MEEHMPKPEFSQECDAARNGRWSRQLRHCGMSRSISVMNRAL